MTREMSTLSISMNKTALQSLSLNKYIWQKVNGLGLMSIKAGYLMKANDRT